MMGALRFLRSGLETERLGDGGWELVGNARFALDGVAGGGALKVDGAASPAAAESISRTGLSADSAGQEFEVSGRWGGGELITSTSSLQLGQWIWWPANR